MQLKESTIRNWRKYLKYGDIKEMCQHTGLSRMTISKVFKGVRVTKDTVEKIKSFIDKKKQLLKA